MRVYTAAVNYLRKSETNAVIYSFSIGAQTITKKLKNIFFAQTLGIACSIAKDI